MSEAVATFQSQLCGVMETVLKAAVYEITRLVEDSFLVEVAKSKQEVEALRQKLQWSETRRTEREADGRSRCVDCGRAGVCSEDGSMETELGVEVNALYIHKRLLEQQQQHCEEGWSSGMRCDSQPSSTNLAEQDRPMQIVGETSRLYLPEPDHENVTKRLCLEDSQCSDGKPEDVDYQDITWTAFKVGDSDSESGGIDSSKFPEYDSEHQSAHSGQQPTGVSEEASGSSVSPLQYLNVKSEANVSDAVSIKDEAVMQPVWSEEVRSKIAHRRHRDPWDRGQLQVEHIVNLSPSLDSLKCLERSCAVNVESLTLEDAKQHLQTKANSTETDLRETVENLDASDKDGCISFVESLTVSENIPTQQCTRDKPFSCKQCGKHFTQHKNLQAHLKRHTGVRPHSCTQCGKGYLYLSHLKVHLLSHSGERPFSCTQCGKSFLSHYYLKVHQRNHTGEKPYSCLQCGKGFTRLSILKEHRTIHTKEKSFNCTQCGKKFTRLSNLKAHLSQHSGKKPYSCTQCGKSFLYFCRLHKHQKKSHRTDY